MMKKRFFAVILACVLAGFGASAVMAESDTAEDPDSFWAEIVDDTTLVTPYYSVSIPEGWAEGLSLETVDNESGKWVKLFYKFDNQDFMGHLFSIVITQDDDYEKIADYDRLGALIDEDDNLYDVIAVYPTDVQCTKDNLEIYGEMAREADNILNTIEAADGCRYLSFWTDDSGNDETGTDETWNETEAGSETEVDPNYTPPVTTESEGYEYWVNEDGETVTIAKYTGEEEVIKVPSEIDGYVVTAIGYQAFTYDEMKELYLPDSISSIGSRAFEYCVISDVLALPENVIIENDAFAYAELPFVLAIPAGAEAGKDSFSYCEGAEVLLVETGAVIGKSAFSYSYDLERAVFADGSSLGEKSFEYCDYLEEAVLCGSVDCAENAFDYCDYVKIAEADAGEYDSRMQAAIDASLEEDTDTDPTEPDALPEPDAEPDEGEYQITLSGEDDVFTEYPSSADAGDIVIVRVVDVLDGEVKIEVNGEDIGKRVDWDTYVFVMPEEDVDLYGWISTEGYAGA